MLQKMTVFEVLNPLSITEMAIMNVYKHISVSNVFYLCIECI